VTLSLLPLFAVAWATEPVPVRAWLPTAADRALVDELGAGFVEGGRGGWRALHVPPDVLPDLSRAGIRWEASPPPPPAAADGYHTPAEMTEALEALASAYPSLTRVVQLGQSTDGRPILALRISAADPPAVGWRVLGAHHGDELSSAALALATAELLLDDYGQDATVTALLDRDVVWVAPHINPDGVERTSRYNNHSVDLNRNYGHEWSPDAFRAGEAPFSEPEARAVRTHGSWNALGAGLSMHSGETNLGWVWNYTTAPVAESDLLEEMAQQYAQACDIPGFWITNGADWYATRGDTNDWSFGRHGVMDFTLEASLSKTPPVAELPALLDGHLPAVRAFLTWPDVAWGAVVDSETGLGIPASVLIVEQGLPLTTGPQGTFGRPIGPGRWTAEVSAPGYTTAWVDLAADAPVHISLHPTGLVQVRATPSILSRTSEGIFELDREADRVLLVRPGEEPVAATPVGDAWQVDPRDLTPGPWTMQLDGEWFAPRSLMIGEVDDAVSIDAISTDPDALTLQGRGLAAGSQAWALFGAARAPVPIAILSETTETLIVDVSGLEEAPDPIDMVVVSNGYQLAALDIRGAAGVDTGAPEDTGEGTDRDTGGPISTPPKRKPKPSKGCHTAPWAPGLGLLVTFVALARRRSP
jgi:hypothetical protein